MRSTRSMSAMVSWRKMASCGDRPGMAAQRLAGMWGSHISVASAWQCGPHRSDRMFHRTHAGAYVHFSRILPNNEKTSKKWPFFGQKLSFLASDKRLKTIFLPK